MPSPRLRGKAGRAPYPLKATSRPPWAATFLLDQLSYERPELDGKGTVRNLMETQ